MKIFTFNYGISDKALESHLETEITRINADAKQDVGFAASKNMDDIEPIINEVNAETDVLITYVGQTLDPETEKLKTEIDQAGIEMVRTTANEEVKTIDKQINAVEIDIKRTRLDYNWAKKKWVNLTIYFLVAIDCLTNFRSFQVVMENLLLSLILAIAIAFGLNAAVHQIGHRIQKAKTRKERIIVFIIGVFSGAIIFFGLGILRNIFYEDSGTMLTSPVWWAVWNTFFYTIAILIAITQWPTNEQILAYEQLKVRKKELQVLQNQKAGIIKTLKSEEAKCQECKQKLATFEKYREALIESLSKERDRIIAMCRKEFALKNGNQTNFISPNKTNNI